MRSLRLGCMPSWVRSRPTISSSLLSSWTVMMRSFGSSNSCRLLLLVRGMLVLLVCSSRCVPFGRRQA